MRGDLSKSWTATGTLTVGRLDRRRAGPTDVAGRYLSPLESDESAPLVIGLAVFADSVVQEISEDGAGSESYGRGRYSRSGRELLAGHLVRHRVLTEEFARRRQDLAHRHLKE